MFKRKHLLIFLLIACVLIGISSVSASDLNQTDDVIGDDQIDDEITLQAENDDILTSPDSSDVLNSTNDETILSKDMSNESDPELSTNYADAYINSITTKYNSGKDLELGWYGYFDGYFKVYNGKSLIHDEYLEGDDLDLKWGLEGLTPGSYSAKLITYNGITLATGKIVIKKSSSKISVKSFKATVGSTFYCYAYVKDKYTQRNYDGGTVKFKINGKTYKASLVEGVAVAKIKIPSKVKKYMCTATFSGGKNVYKSSTKFKITVKKKPAYKVITMKTKMSDTKHLTKYYGNYKMETYKFKHMFTTVCIMLYKNGKMYKYGQYLTKIHYKQNGVWHWSGWSVGSKEAMYHKYYFDNSILVGNVKIKFKV